MSILLSTIPWWGRALAIFGLVLAVFSFGYLKGFRYEEKKFETYQAQEKAVVASQAAATTQKMVEQKKITAEVKDDYKTKLNTVRAYYGVQNIGTSAVPAAGVNPEGTDAASAEYRACEQSDLEATAAEDALTLFTLQQFLLKQGHEVK